MTIFHKLAMVALCFLCLGAIQVSDNVQFSGNIILRLSLGIDIPFSGYLPFQYQIKSSTNGYDGFLIRTSVNNNNLSVFLYNSYGQTNILPLTTGMYTNVGRRVDMGFVGNRLIVSGSNPFSSSALPAFYEYQLGNEQPLPTSLTLVTNFFSATTNCNELSITALTNGALAVVYGLNTFDYVANITLRKSDGTWTNYPPFAITSGTSLTPTYVSSAEMRGTDALWVFLNKDSSHTIATSEFLVHSNTVIQNRQFIFADDNSPVDTIPYGEIAIPQAISDIHSNRVLVAYNNSSVSFGSFTNHYSWVTRAVVVGMNNATNRYSLGISSRNMRTQGSGYAVTQVGSKITLAFIEVTTENTSPTGAFPLWADFKYDSQTDQSANTEIKVRDVGYIMFNPRAEHYVVRYPDGIWHLLINPF